MRCPSDDVMSQYLDGIEPNGSTDQLEAHFNSCSECRQVVSQWVLARSQRTLAFDFGLPLRPGANLGRFVVEQLIGAGAMGAVYSAYDSELQRKVALKLLRQSADTQEFKSQRQLLKEARALARVHHPHVVAVHDVGNHEGLHYVVMELVEGTSLSDWLRQSHPWRDVLRRFIEAGEGLNAAHQVGIVHRDFKAQNVLLGTDHRTRVADFGLAASHESGGVPPQEDTSSAVREDTARESLVGTPLYLAPEQHEGAEANILTDQYQFCAALYEALAGHAPHEGQTLEKLAINKRSLPRPLGRPVPTGISQAVLRGLSPDPRQRFPSMTDLLVQLRPPLRRPAPAMALALTAVAAAIVGFALKPTSPRCDQVASESPWTEARAEQLAATFTKVPWPLSSQIWPGVSRALSSQAESWTRVTHSTCVAHATQLEDDTIWQLRKSCLARHRKQFMELLEILGTADESIAKKAFFLVTALPDARQCDAAPNLLLSVPQQEAKAVAVEGIREHLERNRLQSLAGSKEVISVAEALANKAEAEEYPPLTAQAKLALGVHLFKQGQAPRAKMVLQETAFAAESIGADVLVAQARLWLLAIEIERHDVASAQQLVKAAQAALLRLGSAPALELVLLRHQADLAHLEGHEALFLNTTTRALEVTTQLYGESHYETAVSHTHLAGAALANADFARADEAAQKALSLYENLFGVEHPNIGSVVNIMAIAQAERGHPELAEPLFRRALEHKRRWLGATHPATLVGWQNWASALLELQRLDEAQVQQALASDACRTALGPTAPLCVSLDVLQGEVLLARRDFTTARATFVAVLQKHQLGGAAGPIGGSAKLGLAKAFLGLGRGAEAQASAREALEALGEAARPKDRAEIQAILTKTSMASSK